MREAYKVHQPLKIQIQIESIAAYDNNVILGTRQGHVLMYAVQPNLQLLQYNKHFSKKPIVGLEVVPGLNLLFSLSDNVVSVNDLQRHNFPLIHLASKTKGATAFALDSKFPKSLTGDVTVLVRMCVSIKRRLQLWYWKYDQLVEYDFGVELPDVPKVIAFSGDMICIGFKTEYVLYDISTNTPKKQDLFPISSSRTMDPCISILSDNIFGVAKDEFLISVYANAASAASSENKQQSVDAQFESNVNSPEKKFGTLQWGAPLQQLVWDEPYVAGIVNEGLEIRVFPNADAESLIQNNFELSRIRFLVRGRNGLLYAASASQLWCIEMIDITIQRDQLLQEKKFKLALQLTNISSETPEEKEVKVNEIQTLFAYDLFKRKDFKGAMKEFFKLGTDPYEVIGLFPELKSSSETASFEDKDLELGYLALIDYLTEWRSKIRKESGNKNSLLSIIDTTLLKCYLQTNDSLVASVLRLNNCNLEESERVLKRHKKYEELIILYQTKKQHKLALQLLQSQAKISGSSLFGFERTIQYLQHLDKSNIDLIFEFSDWILNDHPSEGLKIFTEDGLPEVEGLPRYTVLDMLLQKHKHLVIPYLEQIINGPWHETNPQFHNILMKQYKEKILSGEERDKNKQKLVKFLEDSNFYHAETVLKELPTNDLFEERAIILTKLGKYGQALTIYLQVLGETEKAIEYCAKVYDSNDPKTTNIFNNLIKLLLNPPKQSPYNEVAIHVKALEPDVETVIDVIEKYTEQVDTDEVLKLLPADISLMRLKRFLETSMHLYLEKKRQIQVLKGLSYAGHLQLQEERIKLEGQCFKLTELSTCALCKKKFSNQSAFVRMPNGNVVHYSCQKI